MIPYLFLVSFAGLVAYSWALVDPNFTLVSHPLWTQFRNFVIQLGYFHRDASWWIYIGLILALYALYWFVIQRKLQISPALLFSIGFLCLLSYPFLSHDMFNYMFDARIVTLYHSNPYVHPALDFGGDEWLRFMQWVHRPYPYGPTFLPFTLIPSLLSGGKLILNFFLFKLTWVSVYIYTTVQLTKRSPYLASLFALNPLLLIEGLINMHNDFPAICLVLLALLYFEKQKNVFAGFLLVVSAMMKYLTAPYLALLVLNKKKLRAHRAWILLLGLSLVLTAILIKAEIQQWYFLNLVPLMFLVPDWFKKTIPLQIGFLCSYYPFIALGGWDTPERVQAKSLIVLLALVLNGVMLFKKTKGVSEVGSSPDGLLYEMERT